LPWLPLNRFVLLQYHVDQIFARKLLVDVGDEVALLRTILSVLVYAAFGSFPVCSWACILERTEAGTVLEMKVRLQMRSLALFSAFLADDELQRSLGQLGQLGLMGLSVIIDCATP